MDRGVHLIFDGNQTAFRANCTSELYTKDGVRTSAIYGTLKITHSIAESILGLIPFEYGKIKDIVFAWDFGHSERRKKIFPQYKANRKKYKQSEEDRQWMSDFIEQANVLHTSLPLIGVRSIKQKGWEGDDLVYGAIKCINKLYPNDLCVIISTDEDFHQLVSANTWIYNPTKQIIISHNNYKEITGIEQNTFLTYKILKGDSSDGINGVQGIGEKTAKDLVNKYGDLCGILNNEKELMKSKRTARIFSKESIEILDRNNKLINLKDFVVLDEVKDYIEDKLTQKTYINLTDFKAFLKQYQLVNILSELKSWLEVFEAIINNS